MVHASNHPISQHLKIGRVERGEQGYILFILFVRFILFILPHYERYTVLVTNKRISKHDFSKVLIKAGWMTNLTTSNSMIKFFVLDGLSS